jgi:iron(III) transport system substrate-binding protein
MKNYTKLFLFLILLNYVSFQAVASEKAKAVNLYSAQQEHLILPVLEMFTEETGIKVNLITGDAAGLVTRLKQEGENTPADALLTADIGNLYAAKSLGLLQAIKSDKLISNIPANLRDSEGFWYGFTKRARLLFVRKKDVNDGLKNIEYTDLTDKKWKGGILVRSSEHVYNQSLVASILFHKGDNVALDFAKGIVANLSRNPQGSDRDQLRALAAGEGKIAIANSYYYAMMVSDDKTVRDELVASEVVPLIPNQKTTGVHANIRGGGVIKGAKNHKEAIILFEFLSEPKAQEIFARLNNEYPVNKNVSAEKIEKLYGKIKFDDVALEEIGKLQQKAINIVEKAGWR